MSDASEEFLKFEEQADAAVAKLSLWRQPIRSILSLIYLSADSKFVGGRFSRKAPRDDEVGTALISRMSYVSGFFDRCPRLVGADIDDALSVVDKGFQADIEQLLGYAHLCEIVPLVRRGFFSVERGASSFLLKHPKQDFVGREENDILMSEIALPHDLMPPPYPIERCERMVKAWPRIPADDLIGVLKAAYDHYIDNIFELPLLGDDAFAKSFGFPRQDFVRIRAALMAYADFCLGMADAAEILSVRAFPRFRRAALEKEVREWASPLLNRNHLIGVAAGVARVDPSVAEAIVDLFTIVLNDLKKSGGGEGFFPPFLKFDNALLFSPHAVKRMMPERNLLYKMIRTDPKTFDTVISGHLEPSLVQDAIECLSGMPGVEVRPNVRWERGEIDLLALHEPTNTALQIQAKAAVPPQGARMVAQIESRTLEAAKQIKRFLDLDDREKDRICSWAFGRKLEGVTWSSAVMMRTCLGTEKAWEGIAGYVPLNPVLLRAAVKIMTRNKASFAEIETVVNEEMKVLRAKAVLGWRNKSFKLFGETIELPLLDLDFGVISAFRKAALS